MSRDEDWAAENASLRAVNSELVRERDALAKELVQVKQELDGFSYSISHDLRAPLRAIDGFSRALLADYGETLEEVARGHLDRISAGVLRMNTLIEGLLELVRLSRVALAWEQVDLSAQAADVLNDLLQTDPRRDVAIEIESDLSAAGDPALVRNLFQLLLGNAWKFTSRTAAPQIEVRRHPSEPHGFLVRDNGAGFDMAYSQNLFAPFQRLHRAKEFEGVGLGLATAQRIVFRHGGRIWADATLGGGATFCFTLPRETSAPA